MAEPKGRDGGTNGRGDPRKLEELLAVVMGLPRLWVATMVTLAVLSSVEIGHGDHQGWTIHFEVDAITLGAFALIWLPAVLRLLSLAGGRFKGAGVELSSDGLIGTPEALISDLTDIRTGAEEVTRTDRDESTRRLSREIQRQVDSMASQYLSAARAVDEEAIGRLAAEYEAIRARTPSGATRTTEMTRIVNEARVRASANRDAAARSAGRLITSAHEGERIVGLAFVQEIGGNYRLGDVLARIENSASAFEMFHALIALREIEPSLESDQCEVAVRVLEKEKTDYRGVDLMEDANLPRLIDDVISRLQSFEGG
jgi:hypothetical protein